MSFAYFGGIDFSGAREPLSNLWSALGRENDGRLEILSVRPHAFRADLAGYLRRGWREAVGDERRALWGADFPFGIPQQVAEGLGAGASWSSALAWVADRPPDEVRASAADSARTPRATDLAGALAPLDLRLYKQTVEGMRWLQELVEENEVSIIPQRPVESAGVTLIEVYPSATIRDLGIRPGHAPKRAGEARARAAALKTYLDFHDRDCEALAITLEDAWDAVIACLTAFLCRDDLDQPRRVQLPAWERIAAEGWIYRPPAAVGEPVPSHPEP